MSAAEEKKFLATFAGARVQELLAANPGMGLMAAYNQALLDAAVALRERVK